MKINGSNVTVIGITGTIGSGKSTVGKILIQMGVPVIDTDKIVHDLLERDDEVKKLIKQHFPAAIKTNDSASLAATGIETIEINRKQLGAIIFKDGVAKKRLEAILHPKVRLICQQQITEKANHSSKPQLIAVLVPLLFENQLQSMYDQTWTVVADDSILRQRLSKRDGMSAEDIDLRLAGQMSQEQKAKLADIVLDNSGNESELAEKVSHLIEIFRPADEQKSC